MLAFKRSKSELTSISESLSDRIYGNGFVVGYHGKIVTGGTCALCDDQVDALLEGSCTRLTKAQVEIYNPLPPDAKMAYLEDCGESVDLPPVCLTCAEIYADFLHNAEEDYQSSI